MTVRPLLLEQGAQALSGALSLAPLAQGSGLLEPAALLTQTLLAGLVLLALKRLSRRLEPVNSPHAHTCQETR